MDKLSKDYKQICRLAGVLAGTRYATLFVEYIEKNNIPYKDETGEYISKDEIKKIKKEWQRERAGEKKQKDSQIGDRLKGAFGEFKETAQRNNAQIASFYKSPESNKEAEAVKQIIVKVYDELKKIDKKNNPENPMDYDKLMDLAIKGYINNKAIKQQIDLALKSLNLDSNSDLEHTPLSNDEIKQIAQNIYSMRLTIFSLANDLSPADKEAIENLTSPASASFTKGQISDTFGDVLQLTDMAIGYKGAVDMGKIMASLTAASVARLTTSVNTALTNAIAKVMDVSMFINIPIDAAQQMLSSIMTPGEAISELQKMVKENVAKDSSNDAMNEAINKAKAKVNDKLKEINAKHGEGLKKFHDGLHKIVNTPNQAGDWYVENLTTFTDLMENAIIGEINAQTLEICDQKFMLADDMVDVLAVNLVAPVNEAILVAQKFILDKVAKAIAFAINKAKALAAKAIMKILGLLGA